MGPGAQVVFVATVSPLTVTETATSTAVPAKGVTGVTYHVGDAVLVIFAHGVYYVLRAA